MLIGHLSDYPPPGAENNQDNDISAQRASNSSLERRTHAPLKMKT